MISFAAGEPDFNTPEPINKAAIGAIEAGFTKYTPSAGIPALKQAIVEKLFVDNGLKFEPASIIVSCGAKHSVYNSLQVLINPGDEVILLAPYWMTYADQVRLAGGVPVVVPTSAADGFVPDLDQVKVSITNRTKALILNSPSNPTGAVFPRETLKGLAMLAIRHDFWLISDEIYEKLIYGETHQSIAALSQEVAARTITIGGVSKTYAMTGWRIGFAAAPLPVAKAMSNFQDQVTSNPTSFAQVGATEAYRLPPSSVEAMREEFEARRDLIVKELSAIEGVYVPVPKGAFYAFPDVTAFLRGRVTTDAELAEYLLAEAQVACVPGSVFEGAGHIRLSYATSRENIRRGIARIAEALPKLL